MIQPILMILTAAAACLGQMNHPGIFNTQKDLHYIRTAANTEAAHPMKEGWDTLKKSKWASLSYQVKAEAVVVTKASGTNASEENFRNASHAAYAHALSWVVTGNSAHKDKALEILNAWGKTLKDINAGSHRVQHQLEAAWVIPMWTAAGEIMRHFNNGAAKWADADIEKFTAMLTTLMNHAKVKLTTKKHNQRSTAVCAYACYAAFIDSKSELEAAYKWYNTHLKGYINLPGGTYTTDENDYNHMDYGITSLIQAAEVFWHQGIDAYSKVFSTSETMPRLLLGMKHAAEKLNKCQCNRDGAGWEIGVNHYANRTGISLPGSIVTIRNVSRPVSVSESHMPGWSTMTHAELSANYVPTAAKRTISHNSITRKDPARKLCIGSNIISESGAASFVNPRGRKLSGYPKGIIIRMPE